MPCYFSPLDFHSYHSVWKGWPHHCSVMVKAPTLLLVFPFQGRMWVPGYCTARMEIQAPCMDSKNILVGVERHLLPGWDKSLSSLLGLFWHHLGQWVGTLLQPHEGRSPGSPLSLCWHGNGWSHSYPMGFSRGRMVIVYEFYLPMLLLSWPFGKREQFWVFHFSGDFSACAL